MPAAQLEVLPSPVTDATWERIRQATIDLAIERGYDRFEVADIIARAGVSRAEFEARFSGLDDCRDRVYEANIADFDQALVGPYLRAPSWREGLRAAAYGAAEYLPAHRRERRYGELRKRGDDSMALAMRDRYLQRLVDLIDAGREEPGALEGLTRATAEGTLGSIYGLLVKRLGKTGGEGVGWEILPDLMYLAVRPYLGQEAALEELRIPVAPPSPGGEAGRAVGERDRIARAMVELVGANGYERTALADVRAAAGVDEAQFSRHFADKQACFVSVWDELTAAHGVLAGRAFGADAPWRERMRAAAWETLRYLRADRLRTRFLVLEVLNAGEIARAHRDLAIAVQVEWIDSGRREMRAARVSRATAEHLAGAINEMLIRKTRSGEIFAGEAGVLRELMYMTVRPYLGEEAAREELTMPATARAGSR